MKYLKIANWKRWQTYRKGRSLPSWIKIHRTLLRNPDWVGLTDAQQGQLTNIWLLAADKDGRIPDDALFLKSILNMTKAPDLQVFINKGFIEKRRHRCVQLATTSRKVAAQNRIDKNRTEQNRGEEKVAPSPSGHEAAAVPIFCLIPTNKNGEFHGVTEAKVFEYQESYPAIDAPAQVRAARQWCIDNPAKRKTLGGMPAFLNRWLAKEQNSGRGRGAPGVPTFRSETVAEIEARARKGKPSYDAK